MKPGTFPGRKSLRPLRSKRLALLTILLLIPLAALPMGVLAIPKKALEIPPSGFASATTEPLRITVSQEGTIESRKNATLISQCEWSTQIIKLLPEGTWVEPGDVVIELDSSQLREKLLQREVLFVEAKSKLAAAKEDLRIQQLVNESSIAEAQLKAKLARLDLDSYVDAEYPYQLHKLESNAALAEENLVRARKQLEFVNNMVRLGYRNVTEAEKERLAVMEAQQKFDAAVRQVEVLKEYGHERELTRLRGEAEDLSKNEIRTELVAKAAMLSRETRVRSLQKTYEAHRDYLERLQRNIDACTIRAPQAGEVVYATTSPHSTSKIDIESTAYFMRPLVHIPDREHMDVSLRVHETLIRHVKAGQQAKVKISAFQGKELSGHVTSVSTIPMPGQFPYYDLREYRVTVEIDADPKALKDVAPGLSANVEILAAFKPVALAVPVETVFELGGRYFVFVREADDLVPREIEIGLSNDKVIEVLGGLEDGEQVVLQPRVRCAAKFSRLEDRYLTGGWEEAL